MLWAIYQRWQVATARRSPLGGAPPTGEPPAVREIEKFLRRALAAAPLTNVGARAAAHLALANMLDDLGRHLLALEHCGAALRLYTEDGADYDVVVVVVADNMSMSYERIGHPNIALHFAMQAFDGYQRHPERAGELIGSVFWRMDRLGIDALIASGDQGIDFVRDVAQALVDNRVSPDQPAGPDAGQRKTT